jgi:hypothetical protein
MAAIYDEGLLPWLRSDAVELLKGLLGHDALHGLLADASAPIGVRIEAARALRESSDTAEVMRYLTGMRDEASDYRNRADIAVLLSQIGGPQLAVEALMRIGRDRTEFSSMTSDSIAEGLIKLGHIDELSDLAHDSGLFGSARLQYAERLLAAGAHEAALSAARAVAKNDGMEQLAAAGIIGRTGHPSEALALIRDALERHAPFGGQLSFALYDWATLEDVWELACNDKFGTGTQIELVKTLAGSEFSARAAALLQGMASDTGLDDGSRVQAAMALALMDDETHSRAALEPIARDPTADAVARQEAAEALWPQDAPSDAAMALLEILRDPGLGLNRCKTLTRMLCQLSRQDALLALVNYPLIEARTRLDIAQTVAGCGMRDEALTFLWDISDGSDVALSIRELASSILIELGQRSRLLKWAARESTSPSARLAVAKTLVHTPDRDRAARLIKRALQAATQLSWDERFTAAQLLADAGDPSFARQLALDPQVDEAVANGAIFALERLERVGNICEIAGNDGLPTTTRLAAASSLERLGRTNEAAAVAHSVTSGFPAEGRPMLECALAYERAGLFDEAVAQFDLVAQDRALDSGLRCMAAMGLSRLNDLGNATRVLTELLSESSTPPKVAAAAAKALGERGLYPMGAAHDAVRLLWRCAHQDGRPSVVRVAAAAALGAWGAARSLREVGLRSEMVGHVASDGLPAEVRVALTDALVWLDEGPLAVAQLTSIAVDAEQGCQIRSDALSKLWELRNYTRHQESVRKAASAALRALRTEPSIPALLEVVVTSAAV